MTSSPATSLALQESGADKANPSHWSLLREIAEENRRLIESLDTPMEALTQLVCPTCSDVCCISRHGQPAPDDHVYFSSLNLAPPPVEPGRPETAPCQNLGSLGCALPRAMRPYRCTWYFCTPLIRAMEELPAKQVRAMNAHLSRLSSARVRLMEAYAAVAARGPDHPNDGDPPESVGAP